MRQRVRLILLCVQTEVADPVRRDALLLIAAQPADFCSLLKKAHCVSSDIVQFILKWSCFYALIFVSSECGGQSRLLILIFPHRESYRIMGITWLRTQQSTIQASTYITSNRSSIGHGSIGNSTCLSFTSVGVVGQMKTMTHVVDGTQRCASSSNPAFRQDRNVVLTN